ncbi:hypothetical protein K504DRAFT_467034 [Pleomassaria siparia CBS 279.74]|uniref:Uncharacterized protein n=1 Tax=Pleomassaria siparia CBS 279.74 TaxID=1314801 RepID=A0A6G1KDL8_9PLEO|nr:hypothetical protein K504DRAFT_467034 [Pleomassaria siparia CBS 279.74]
MDEPNSINGKPESKQEALMRLLCHYLIYIGKATSLLDAASDERALVDKWRSHWNKPAAFTWNPSNGLEMHYRIQPPAEWIVSSNEDESMSSIDSDLSEMDDGDEFGFTVNSDLLKCAACDMFWAMLDTNGLCQNCQFPFDAEWDLQGLKTKSTADAPFASIAIPLHAEPSFEHYWALPSAPEIGSEGPGIIPSNDSMDQEFFGETYSFHIFDNDTDFAVTPEWSLI